MPLFALDAVRNAPINHSVEILLEEMREQVAAFPFPQLAGSDTVEDALLVYDQSRPRFNVILSLLAGTAGKRGVDISTGFGFLPALLAAAGAEMCGTEIDTRAAAFAASRGISIKPYRIGDSPYFAPDKSFDFVVLGEVLEHLKHPPVWVVREVTRALRPGGRFILTTPNVSRLAHIEALAAGENFLEPFPESIAPGSDATDTIEHVREYSVREVVEAVEGAGLAIDQVLMTGWGQNGYNPLPNPYANEIMVVSATR